MTDDQRTIVAVTGEDDRYAPVRSRASAMAAGSSSTVILYDVDAPGVFSSPVPTEWSGEGEQELTPDRMGPEELEAQGRKPLADQVRSLRDVGVDAWAWLPTSADAQALAQYAEQQGADVILVPKDAEEPGLLDRLQGKDTSQARESTRIPVVAVG
jgi:nucleotide-binding universal stress UspA family protein